MIALAAAFLALAQQAIPPIGKYEMDSGDVVRVEALVRLPKLGPHEQAALTLLANCLPNDSVIASKREMEESTAEAGGPVKVSLQPDCLRLQFSLRENQLNDVLPIVSQVLHEAKLEDETVSAKRKDLEFARFGVWESALTPQRPKTLTVQPDEVREIYFRLIRPENIWIEIGGSKRNLDRDFQAEWNDITSKWEYPKLRTRLVDKGAVPVAIDRPGKLTTMVLRSSPILPQKLYTAMLGAFMLGSGKGATVFTVLREQLGWSYRQEAPLRGVAGGFEQLVTAIAATSPEDFNEASAMKDELLAAVGQWQEADRTRALGMARAVLSRGEGMNPLYFLGASTTLDPLYLRAYWRLKTGTTYDPVAIIKSLESVSLDDAKKAVQEELTSAGTELIRGKD